MTAQGDLESLRQEVRSWLDANVPRDWREVAKDQGQFLNVQKSWFRKLVDAGYATPHWPEGWPGGGRSLAEQKIIYEELARADAPRLILYFVALYHTASTLFEWATPEQQAELLPRILKGEVWCQGFSEPNAGSDLASLRCKAERRGDVYVVNGQKIWSTLAQYADNCLLLVRTSSDGPKQAGITFLLMDMRSKGVTVRPINQITGDEEFSEIFLDDVEIPVANRLGEENQGWAVTQSTLSSERGLTLLELSDRLRGALWRIASLIKEKGRADDQGVQRDFARLITRIEACRALADQFLLKHMAGEDKIGDASIVKLFYARVLREFASLGSRLGGIEEQYRMPITYGGGQETGNWMADFMNSYAWSIAAGSDEIQKNMVAERLLGMPREPKTWTLQGAGQ